MFAKCPKSVCNLQKSKVYCIELATTTSYYYIMFYKRYGIKISLLNIYTNMDKYKRCTHC